jgi:hypothetical protein
MAQHPWKVERQGARPAERPRPAPAPGPAAAGGPRASSPDGHAGSNGRGGSLLGRIAGGAAALAADAARVGSSLWRRSDEPARPRVPWTRRQECTDLLSYLRAAVDKPVPTVVIAGAAGGEGTTRIVDGLAEAARDAGVRLFAAELAGSPGRPLLRQRQVIALPQPVRGPARPVASGRRLTAGTTGDARSGAAAARPSATPAAATGPAEARVSGMPAAGAGATAGRTSVASAAAGGGAAAGSLPLAAVKARSVQGTAQGTAAAAAAPTSGAKAGELPGEATRAGEAAAARARTGDPAGEAASPGAAASAAGLGDADAPQSGTDALAKVHDGPGAGGLSRWSEHTGGGGVDFILVEAPPLDRAADAALLARACDGLVLVVESDVTPRSSLRRAARLAEVSGCRVFGLVMSEGRRTLPDWLERFLSGTSRGR